MNKLICIILPILVVLLSVATYFALGANRPDHFETPIVLAIVFLLFVKVLMYNRQLKKDFFQSQAKRKDQPVDIEKLRYQQTQQTINFLILEMFIVYVVVTVAFGLIF